MVCAALFNGEVEFDAAKLEDEAFEYVLETYFGLAQSQVLKPKVLFGSSRIFSGFSGAWREVHWACILLVLKCFSRHLSLADFNCSLHF